MDEAETDKQLQLLKEKYHHLRAQFKAFEKTKSTILFI